MGNGDFSAERAPRDVLLENLPKNGIGAEIGVWTGNFSARIIGVCNPSRLLLIDPWVVADDEIHADALYGRNRNEDMEAAYRSVVARFASRIAAQQVAIVRKRSAEALAELPDDSLDYTYIDGDHAYDVVAQDLALAKQKVKPYGLICGDDYMIGHWWWGDGVVRAVHDTLARGGLLIHLLCGSQFMIKRLA